MVEGGRGHGKVNILEKGHDLFRGVLFYILYYFIFIFLKLPKSSDQFFPDRPGRILCARNFHKILL